MDSLLEAKQRKVLGVLEALDAAVVAYSGGVDSSLLAALAHRALGPRSLVVTAVSPSLAGSDLDRAAAVARAQGWSHRTIDTAELHNEAYATNDGSRCYWCKTELFGALAPLARDLGARVLVGTNADDLGDHRPGIAAGREHGALTPLADAGLGKDEVRALSRAAGLPTSEQPASPCLASRFAYGVRVTEPGLRRIEKAEEKMRELGFSVLRVRDHGDDLARIEVPPEDVPRVAALRAEIARDLVALGFKFVSVDLMGFRSGSLNAVLPAPTLGTR